MLPLKRLVIFFGFAVGLHAHAAELVTIGEDPRSLGMGGVRVLSENGTAAASMFWNPAALSYLTGVRWNIFTIGAATNSLSQAQALSGGLGGGGGGLSALDPFYGTPIFMGGLGYTAIAVPYFGFGVFDFGRARFMLNNPAFPAFDVSYINDYGYAIATSLDFGSLSTGISFKRISRAGGTTRIGADVLTNLNNTSLAGYFANEGVGYGVDLGIMYRVPAPLNPTIGISWLDVGTVSFQQAKGTTPVPNQEDNMIVSLTGSSQTALVGLSLGLEYRHVRNSAEQLGKKLHIGSEVNLPFFDIRGGLYQGYPVFGLGIDLVFFQFDLAVYKVETGVYPGQTPDNRIAATITTSMSFDPNFKMMDFGSSGPRRKLKQRR